MSEDMPKVWWSPSDRSLYAKRFDHGYSEIAGEYDIDELPSDAVELRPVSDAPAAPIERYDQVLIDPAVADHPFIEYAEGVTCHACKTKPAAHKVGEEIDLPFHNLTAYLCCGCFRASVGDCSRWPYTLGRPAEVTDDV